MKEKMLLPGLLALAASLPAQISFTDKTNLLTPQNHFGGIAIAVCDMNGDGLDDIVRLHNGNTLNIQYQTLPGQAFLPSQTLNLPGTEAWGMCAADVDNDGLGDVLFGGSYDGIRILRGSADGTWKTQTFNSPPTFVQGVNFADIDNDGWLDAFVCHDDGISRIFQNNGNGTFALKPNMISLATLPASDNSGNYGAVWSDVDNDGDLDLYIAKCRQNVNAPTDPRRINQLFLNNGDYTYTQDVANTSGLRIGWQSWTADFGDIDNDGDFDCFITNHDASSQLLENDGSGHFTDITATSGLFEQVPGYPLQGIFRDFDNDGFADILVAGTQHRLFRNNGNKTFSAVANPFGARPVESFAVGDLDNNGFQDVYASYSSGFAGQSYGNDILWLNEGNDNHFIGLTLRGKQSNRSGVGAKIRLYSTLGIQTKEVRSGESYGISNSLQVHFGLGQLTTYDSIVINWPSGTRDVIYDLGIDQYHSFYEGGCTIPNFSIWADGPTAICPGQSLNLKVSLPFEAYLWSTGETTATIAVSQSGVYNVTVTSSAGCSEMSNQISVIVDPPIIPSIEVLGDTLICEGSAVQLRCSEANAYLWSTGETTQSITVNTAGSYSVAALGLCSFFEAPSVKIALLDVPLPVIEPDTVLAGQSATLVAQGAYIVWYDSLDASTPIATGNSFTTPPLSETTTFWATNTVSNDQPNVFTGQKYHQGSISSDPNYNGGLIFDCHKPFRLTQTKVYAIAPGNRKIVLLASDGTVLQSKSVMIPKDTSLVKLDFDVPVGENLKLTTDAAFNLANLGYAGPQLRRSTAGIHFPYEIPGMLSIKNSTFDQSRYYYFYDWEIDFYSLECTGPKTPVTAVVKQSSAAFAPTWASSLHLSPNPVREMLNLSLAGFPGGNLQVEARNAQGQLVRTANFQLPAGEVAVSIDMSHLPGGLYWLDIRSAAFSLGKKVVVGE